MGQGPDELVADRPPPPSRRPSADTRPVQQQQGFRRLSLPRSHDAGSVVGRDAPVTTPAPASAGVPPPSAAAAAAASSTIRRELRPWVQGTACPAS
ncbi:unnamed protein product [Ixodes pacificus]